MSVNLEIIWFWAFKRPSFRTPARVSASMSPLPSMSGQGKMKVEWGYGEGGLSGE